ncbi:MAG: DUF721 domain-containing protein [Rhizobiaceae bacterium]|nr:DUF721 domain-containing protein [Rhizobiaceae bacterium]
MAANRKNSNPVPVGDVASGILDPVLRRRAGISVGLVQNWDEIAGPQLAGVTRPEKVVWPRRGSEDEPFEPATLVVSCSGASALHLQHQSAEVIGRVNAYLGFAAIGRLRIVQKPVGDPKPKPVPPRSLSQDETRRIAGTTAGIEDEDLRTALQLLGRNVVGSKR